MNGTSITAIIGTILATVPAFLPMIPAPFGAIAAIVLNAANSIWHLYQPAPSTPTPPPASK